MIRRLNLYGGPGSGKSTKAAELFVLLRKMKFSVELVHEIVKEDAFNKRPIEGPYQIRRFGEQVDVEHNRLKGAKLIVTDSPLYLQCYYTKSRGEEFWTEMNSMADLIERQYPSFNIFLDRNGISYDPAGRFQSEDQAIKVDIEMEKFLDEVGVKYTKVETRNDNEIVNRVLSALGYSSRVLYQPATIASVA